MVSREDNGAQEGETWHTGDSNESVTVANTGKHVSTQAREAEDLQKLGAGLSLGIAFASSCGGMGTVIGTPTNVVFFGMVADTYGADTPLSFGTWAAYGIPLSLILLICLWVILGIFFIGPKKFFACNKQDRKREASILQILQEEKATLGPVQ